MGMTETQVNLGKGKGFVVSPKAKFQNSAYCERCEMTVMVGDNHKCMVCGSKIKRMFTDDSLKKRFEKICASYNNILNDYQCPDRDINNGLYVCVKIRWSYYMVPLRMLQDFKQLNGSAEQYKKFFENIRKTCPIPDFS